jgi:uncharacterized protein (DUF697 family)
MSSTHGEQIRELDEKADNAITAMVSAVIGTALVPAHVNWALTGSAMGAGVIAIAACYKQHLSKDEAWKLVKDFFLAAGAWFVAMELGTKIFSAILSTTGIGHVAAVGLDGAISGVAAYAIGRVAKEYFRRGYLGDSRPTKQEIKTMFRDAFAKKKAELR